MIWEALDLEVAEGLEAWLDARSPGLVIGCAALSSVGDCERDPQRAELLNARLPGRIGAWCAGSGARYVHVSTDLVFGSTAPPGGFTEDAEPDPVSVYGRTKREGEIEVLDACPGALVVRLPLLYGNSGGRGAGASDSLLAAVDGGERPGLFVDEWRTPLEVSNAADALLELGSGDAHGILHVAGPDRVSRYQLGTAVLEAMGLAAEEAAGCVQPMPRGDAPEDVWRLRSADAALAATAARSLLDTELLGLRAGLRRAIG